MRQDSSNKGQAQVRTRSVSILPDGRRFVVEDEVTKIIDVDGNEIEPAPMERAALMALCAMK
jgi:hypothetical protein